jgi:hypothetical protein
MTATKPNDVEIQAQPLPSKVGLGKGRNEHFCKWFNDHVQFSLAHNVTLKECYESYKGFLMDDLAKLPLNKRGLAVLLRSHLEPYREMDMVSIVTRSKVIIYGITLPNSSVSK